MKKHIEPELKNSSIKYIGPVNDQQKLKLFQEAKAFLFPIKWEEPFGIVMAESLACGCPILAFRRGSVPEVVEHGINGFICKDIVEMSHFLEKIEEINSKDCRRICEDKFSLNSVANDYLNIYLKHSEEG